MEEAEMHLLERICVAPASGTPSAELAPHHLLRRRLALHGPRRAPLLPPRRPGRRAPAARCLPAVHAHPLAGTLSPAARCFSYSSGHDALDLVLVESTEDFDRLVATGPRDLSLMRPLVPALPPPEKDWAFALATLQATVFPGRRFCIGVSVHHTACDDASAMLFV